MTAALSWAPARTCTVSPLVLNLGCGAKTSGDPEVLNVDWSILLRLRGNPILRRLGPVLVGSDRRDRLAALPPNIVVANLAKGIPVADGEASGVYHSHLLEHLEYHTARTFFLEIRRVLAPGGVHRAVVPDFEALCRAYLRQVRAADAGRADASAVDCAIASMIEQMVRLVPAGTSKQAGIRKAIELRLLGDARARGETHQWMYDRHTLVDLFERCGFSDVRVRSWNESAIPRWAELGLEVDDLGGEYRPQSVYVEGVRP